MPEQPQRLVYECEQWQIDLARRELRAGGVPVPLGGRAFEIMELLVRSAGQLVTKDEMMERVWPGVVVGENTLQVHVHAVRKALGTHRSLLKTASGRGYRLTGAWTRTIGPASEPMNAAELKAPGDVASGQTPRFGNLPMGAVELIGRAETVQRLLDLVSAYRVVTLTGPGGIGKTKLALEVGRGLMPAFCGDVWFVDLVSLSDPALVSSTVASTLNLDLDRRGPSPSSVAHAIGKRRLLIVLDNCEHLIGATAELAETLLRHCPNVSILGTSRERLRIDGEINFRVPPLDVPPQGPRSTDDISAHSAVELFIARMGDQPANRRHDSDLLKIGELCRRLDGMPLAIELAASRAATLGPEQVLAHLDDRFALLTGGRRTALPRHQTLGATLDWSYELLPEWEKRLLRSLAVFPAGFALDAAVNVASREDVPALRVAEGIANLAEKSLVDLDKSTSVARWRLLETTRIYALARLAEAGEVATVMRRQAEFFCGLFQTTAARLELKSIGPVMSGFAREIDNVRAALDWSFSIGGDSALGVRLTAAYVPVWLSLSLVDECLSRSGQALAALEREPPEDLRELMHLHTALGWQQMSGVPVAGGTTSWRAVLRIGEEIGDIDHQLHALWALWVDCKNGGRPRDGLSLADRFVALAEKSAQFANRFVGERIRGKSLHMLGRHTEARVCIERMLSHHVPSAESGHFLRSYFDQKIIAYNTIARISWIEGHQERALKEVEDNIQRAIDLGHHLSMASVLAECGCPVAFLSGNLDLCERYTAQLREESRPRALDVWNTFAECFSGELLIRRGQVEAGINRLGAGIEKLRRANFVVYHQTQFLSALASGLAKCGQIERAHRALDDALDECTRTGEAWFLPELYRIRGEIAILADSRSMDVAEALFTDALRIAGEQGALSWELRTANSMALLWRSHGRSDQVPALLIPIVDRFPKGNHVLDLDAARGLLRA